MEIKPDFAVEYRIAYMYALKEDYAESMKWLEQFISSVPAAGRKAEGFLWIGIYHFLLGKKESAFSNFLRAEKLADEAGDWPRKVALDYTRGWLYFELGELELSKEYLQKAWDVLLSESPKSKGWRAGRNFSIGLVEAKQGKIDLARSRLAEIKSLLPELTPASRKTRTFHHDWLQAEILMAQGSLEKAIEVLEKIAPPDVPSMYTDNIGPYNMPFIRDVLARAYHQNRKLDKAISEYERKITFDPDSKDRHLIHPKYHYLLAKLYQEKGLPTKAIEQYQVFLDLWKDADPILPELQDAKKRLVALKK
jgi:tetratricopeptide (TPR) repeat protein